MLLFRSEEEIQAWCTRHAEPRGDAVLLSRVWHLAQSWYGNRMDPSFRGRSREQARAIFAEVGLTAAFWQGDNMSPS